MNPRYLSISGMMGSGKTTLARNIARLLGYQYIPESRIGPKYLSDLFINPERWAFDAQVAFFTEKAIQLKRHIRLSRGVVLDRSFSEDSDIFAQHFMDSDQIDERSCDTYKNLTQFVLSELPEPDLTIYCDVGLHHLKERLDLRSRQTDANYPEGHIEAIYERYQNWKQSKSDSNLVLVDSEILDFRRSEVVAGIVNDFLVLFQSKSYISDQIDLFDSAVTGDPSHKLPMIRNKNGESIFVGKQFKDGNLESFKSNSPLAPYVYIAAPFTGVAVDGIGSKESDQKELFEKSELHGRIKDGTYRRTLNKASKFFESNGLNVLLPHRDINDWGKKHLRAVEVMSSCSQHVSASSLFFGLLGQSTGAHYEYGVAKALGVPSIICHCEELNDSFVALGIEANSETLVISCKRINEIESKLNSEEVRVFLQENSLLNER